MTDEQDKSSKNGGDGVVEEALIKSRTVIITGEINDKLARTTVARLLALSEISNDPISLYISSPGGHVESGDMVHDMIKFIRPTVRTIGSGWVASAGALIFVGAKLENRFCLPNTRFLLHQPSGSIGGSATELEIQAKQLANMRERFEHLFAAATGQTSKKIHEDTARDFWLNTDEALEYGLLGSVIESSNELPKQ
jgi:ATP-dependent Clp protease, protease subunit